jgi:putative membrane protein (TIGR04086 family)
METGTRQPATPPRMEPAGVFTGLKLRPILIGCVVDYVGTYAAMFAWILFFVSRRVSAQEEAVKSYLFSNEGLLIGFAIGMVCTALGGYVAGRQAKAMETKHGAFVGVGSLVVSALEQSIAEIETPPPQWYMVLAVFAAVPAGALGGYVSERWHQLFMGRR